MPVVAVRFRKPARSASWIRWRRRSTTPRVAPFERVFYGIKGMFDDIIHGLQQIPEQQTISVSVPVDDDGYYDRECPAEECRSAFKVLFVDWREKVPDERAFCAICGEDREPSAFTTIEQTRWIKEAGDHSSAGPTRRHVPPRDAAQATGRLHRDEPVLPPRRPRDRRSRRGPPDPPAAVGVRGVRLPVGLAWGGLLLPCVQPQLRSLDVRRRSRYRPGLDGPRRALAVADGRPGCRSGSGPALRRGRHGPAVVVLPALRGGDIRRTTGQRHRARAPERLPEPRRVGSALVGRGRE